MIIEILIKQEREKAKISIRELADLTGIERHRIADIENGIIKEDEILFVEMLLIAENLGISILQLFRIEHVGIG